MLGAVQARCMDSILAISFQASSLGCGRVMPQFSTVDDVRADCLELLKSYGGTEGFGNFRLRCVWAPRLTGGLLFIQGL